MNKVIISARHLKKEYTSDGTSNTVIPNLNLNIHEGEFTVIMGSSGSGKSTLLYLMSGLDQVSGGEIWFQDQPVHLKTEQELCLLRRRHMGFVFQYANLVPNLSLMENILVAGYLNNSNKGEIKRRTEALLRKAGIEELSHRLPSQISGGQQQRCAMVRALINFPKILFADEPTGSLNSAASHSVLDVFTSFHQKGQTILMVTHDVKSACRGQRILYFRDGDIVDEMIFNDEVKSPEAREKVLTGWLVLKGW